jgi:hypothetical protein
LNFLFETEQWSTEIVSTVNYVEFPINFPTNCYAVVSGGTRLSLPIIPYDKDKFQQYSYNWQTTGGTLYQAGGTVAYIMIGY